MPPTSRSGSPGGRSRASRGSPSATPNWGSCSVYSELPATLHFAQPRPYFEINPVLSVGSLQLGQRWRYLSTAWRAPAWGGEESHVGTVGLSFCATCRPSEFNLLFSMSSSPLAQSTHSPR